MKKIKFVILVIFILATSSCENKYYNDTLIISDNFFKLIKKHKYKETLSLFKTDLIDKKDYENFKKYWINNFIYINEKLGNIENYELTEWHIEKAAMQEDLPDGNYYYLTYDVKYTKHSAFVILTLYRPFKSENICLMNYNIDSNELK